MPVIMQCFFFFNEVIEIITMFFWTVGVFMSIFYVYTVYL